MAPGSLYPEFSSNPPPFAGARWLGGEGGHAVAGTSHDHRELTAAYHGTYYRVYSPHGWFDLQIGERCSALDRCMESVNASLAVFLSAVNPGSRLLSATLNAVRDRALCDALSKCNMMWLPAAGIPQSGNWPVEPSVLILGCGGEQGLSWAKAWGQRAFLLVKTGGAVTLIWCDAPDPLAGIADRLAGTSAEP